MALSLLLRLLLLFPIIYYALPSLLILVFVYILSVYTANDDDMELEPTASGPGVLEVVSRCVSWYLYTVS